MSRTPEHRAYYAAKNRCTNPNFKQFKDYGGRGIKFLYQSFDEFLADVGLKPSSKHSLGREENDGNYEPGNCRWETAEEQWRNRRVAMVSLVDLQIWFGAAKGQRIWEIIRAKTSIKEG